MFDPDDRRPTEAAIELIDTCHAADGMLWSSPLYQGTIAGAFKNALDWLRLLEDREPPFLHDKVVGLISTAGGTQGLQAINTMEFATRALRAWAVPWFWEINSSDASSSTCRRRTSAPSASAPSARAWASLWTLPVAL
jgi:FMN reductase